MCFGFSHVLTLKLFTSPQSVHDWIIIAWYLNIQVSIFILKYYLTFYLFQMSRQRHGRAQVISVWRRSLTWGSWRSRGTSSTSEWVGTWTCLPDWVRISTLKNNLVRYCYGKTGWCFPLKQEGMGKGNRLDGNNFSVLFLSCKIMEPKNPL